MVTDRLSVRILPASSASTIVAFVVLMHPLGLVPRAVAIAFLVASWASALIVARRVLRMRASVTAAIGAVTAAGQVNGGHVFIVASALFSLACLAALRTSESAAPTSRGRIPASALLLFLTTTVSVAGLLLVGLPILAIRVNAKIASMLDVNVDQATAFSTQMVLGSTRGMLQSDNVAMRIEGDVPEYLRGAVYDRYDAPHWITSARGRHPTRIPAPLAFGPGTARLTLSRRAPVGDDMRWFLPVDACELGEASGALDVDAFGVARRGHVATPASITFRVQGCPSRLSSIAPPDTDERTLSPSLRGALVPIALAWTNGARSDREKAERIREELKKLDYALAVERDPSLDPIVDFLTVHRAGHCEMFASSMALLLRAVEVPTRVVGGYLVSETNMFTGRAVVRDRNAHAWVEVWYDGTWHTWDPTPQSESFARPAKTFDHLVEAGSFLTELAIVNLARLGPLGVSGILGVVLVTLLTIRRLGAVLRARTSRSAKNLEVSRPLPCFAVLSNALASKGLVRENHEPIEAFARRIKEQDAGWAREAAEALLAYAALRYGGSGSEAHVGLLVEHAADTVAKSRAVEPVKTPELPR